MKKKIAAFALAVCVAPVWAFGQGKTTDVAKGRGDARSEGKSNFEWRHKSSDDNGDSLEITMHKKVEFNDDFTEIVRVPAGGYFEVRDRRGGTVRWFEAKADAGGRVQRRYTVDGERREFDREAQAWLSGVLTAAVRNGLYAEETARRILRERGASAVLDETANVTNDYARVIFFNVVLEQPRPDARTVERVLRQARNLSSEYGLANILVAASKSDLGDDRLRAAFFDALDRIKSDYYLQQVLTSAVESHRREAEVLLRAVAAVRGISSDYYKAQVLLRMAKAGQSTGALRDALLDAARGISSDYYRNQVLSAVGGGRA